MLRPNNYAKNYGFIADYLCEINHALFADEFSGLDATDAAAQAINSVQQ